MRRGYFKSLVGGFGFLFGISFRSVFGGEIRVSSTQGKRRIWRRIGDFIAPERGTREFSVFAKKP